MIPEPVRLHIERGTFFLEFAGGTAVEDITAITLELFDVLEVQTPCPPRHQQSSGRGAKA